LAKWKKGVCLGRGKVALAAGGEEGAENVSEGRETGKSVGGRKITFA
jgi:hypothetical protein